MPTLWSCITALILPGQAGCASRRIVLARVGPDHDLDSMNPIAIGSGRLQVRTETDL